MNRKTTEYDQLITAYADDLYRYALWLSKDKPMAEDLVQETCLRAWKSISKLRDQGSLKSWLFTILRNEYARQFARFRPDFANIDTDFLPRKETESDFSTEAFVLRRALDELAEEYREPLLLQVLGGFSCEEIGSICGISKGATMTRLFRAKQKLRELLGPKV